MKFFQMKRSPTIVPARRIYQSHPDAEFKVDVDVECCVHGYLAKDKKQPATLLILAAQLVCVENGNFNLFRMEIDFVDQDKADKPCEPVILSSAPYSIEERIYEEVVETKNTITSSHKKTKKLTASAGVAEAAAKVGLDGEVGAETQRTEAIEYQSQVHYFSKGSSNTRVDEASGRRNGVWWNVKKSTNPKTGDDAGIPPNYMFAVLLRRRDSATPFEAHVRLFSEAGWAHRKEKIVEIVARHLNAKHGKHRPAAVHRPLSQELADFAAGNYEGRPMPVVFDPSVKLEGDCAGIDRMQLGKYLKKEELQKLTMRPTP